MNYYLDSSVIVALLLPDVHSSKSDNWVVRTRPTFIISDFCKIEFAAVVSRRARMKRLTARDATEALINFDAWLNNIASITPCSADDMSAAETLVRDFLTKLAAPDAIHLATAKRLNATLVTFDDRLAEAARQQAVAVVIPD